MNKQKTEGKTHSQGPSADPGRPISPLYEVEGKQCRQYTDGWYCTCGGVPGDECAHIPVAKEKHKEAKAAAKEERTEEAE